MTCHALCKGTETSGSRLNTVFIDLFFSTVVGSFDYSLYCMA